MADAPSPSHLLAERLERGEVIYFPTCPFPLPLGEERRFLLEQQLSPWVHKNISYDPHRDKAFGFRRHTSAQAERLREVLAAFSQTTAAWLTSVLPCYASAWRLDRASFRPEEEATRRLRQTARNDLLHVDAFPSRPSHGDRILRLFANVHATEPRVWVTSEMFGKLLARFGKAVGLPMDQGRDWGRRLGQSLLGVFQPARRRSAYDAFMLRFHHFLKAHEDFQEHGRKHYWHFPPGSAWMVFTDGVSHAALRGRYALEHSFFIAPPSLALPEEAPAFLLEQAGGFGFANRAA